MPIAAPLEVTSRGLQRTISLSNVHLESAETAGEISLHLNEMSDGEIGEQDDRQLSLDLASVKRISSNGLNDLIGINRLARNRGIRLVLVDVQDSVREIFTLTRLERMFEFGVSNAES